VREYIDKRDNTITLSDEDDCFGVSVADAAWAAGFFDGEGCIVGSRTKTGGRYYFTLLVAVGQVDIRPLEHLKELFGGSIQHQYSSTTKRQTLHQWIVTSGLARHFLRTILPYLWVKRERAELALSVSPEKLWEQPNRARTLAAREAAR
jgi:hypothetical protein